MALSLCHGRTGSFANIRNHTCIEGAGSPVAGRRPFSMTLRFAPSKIDNQRWVV